MQRNASFPIPFRARDLLASQPAAALDPNALGAHAQRAGDALLHGAPEGHPALELEGDVLRHQLCVEVRPPHLVDVDEDLPRGELPQLLLELLDLRPLLADDDAGTGRVDVDLGLVGGPLDLDLGDAGVMKPPLEETLDLEILVQQFGVVVPAYHFESQDSMTRMRKTLGCVFCPILVSCPVHSYNSLRALQALSSTTTVRWLSRLRMRLARPIPRGMNRFPHPRLTDLGRFDVQQIHVDALRVLGVGHRRPDVLATMPAQPFGTNLRIGSASSTERPLTWSTTSLILRGETRANFVTARASMAISSRPSRRPCGRPRGRETCAWAKTLPACGQPCSRSRTPAGTCAVVNRDGVADHVRCNRGTPGPGLDHPPGLGPIHLIDLAHQVVVHERTLLDRSSHAYCPFLRFTMYLSEGFTPRVR